MEKGGAWMGFHFAGFALTPSDFPQDWSWYHDEFLGAGSYRSNTWRPTSAVLRVEAPGHPALRGLPATFTAAPNEWYRWEKDLRQNPAIQILLAIDPSSFPLGTGPKPHEIWHEGYYPVVWTNRHYRMAYVNMGHDDLGDGGRARLVDLLERDPEPADPAAAVLGRGPRGPVMGSPGRRRRTDRRLRAQEITQCHRRSEPPMVYDRSRDRDWRSSMMRTRTVGSLALAAAALVLASLSVPVPAEAHGHRGGGWVGVGVGGFYGWGPGPYWGWGAPFWGWGWGGGPYAFGAPGDAAIGYAMMSGMGGLDMSVNPKQAEVWVDGKYVAEARELDGNPSYLWLKKGPHHLVVYQAGFRSLEEDVEVNVGMIRELKVKLEPGESAPPVRAAADVRPSPLARVVATREHRAVGRGGRAADRDGRWRPPARGAEGRDRVRRRHLPRDRPRSALPPAAGRPPSRPAGATGLPAAGEGVRRRGEPDDRPRGLDGEGRGLEVLKGRTSFHTFLTP